MASKWSAADSIVAAAPGRQTADPVGGEYLAGREVARVVGKRQGLGVVHLVEIALGDAGIFLGESDTGHRLGLLGGDELLLGTVGVTGAKIARDEVMNMRGRAGERPPLRAVVGIIHAAKRDPDRIGGNRAARGLGAGRLAAKRELIDLRGARLVGILLQPVIQLLVGGAVAGRVHVALKLDVTHKQRIVELLDQPVGGAPLRFFLKREDLFVEGDVAGRKAARARRRPAPRCRSRVRPDAR